MNERKQGDGKEPLGLQCDSHGPQSHDHQIMVFCANTEVQVVLESRETKNLMGKQTQKKIDHIE